MKKTSLVLCLASLSLTAQATPMYTAQDIGSLGAGFGTYATAINDNGQILGTSFDSSYKNYNFLVTNGQMAKLDPVPGSTTTALYGLNNKGQVVGWNMTGVFTPVTGILTTPVTGVSGARTVTDLGGLGPRLATGDNHTTAVAINDAGTIVGQSILPDETGRAYSWTNGTMTNLGALPGVATTEATAINKTGAVTGNSYYSDGSTIHGFVYRNGAMQDIGTLAPGDTGNSTTTGINDSGTVIGTATAANGANHAFAYANGTMTDLGGVIVPAGTFDADTEEYIRNFQQTYATGINNAGTIVGSSNFFGATVETGGTMYALTDQLVDPLDTRLQQAVGINNQGQIVAIGYNGHSYLLTDITGTTGMLAGGTGTGGSGSGGGTTGDGSTTYGSSNDTATEVPEPAGTLPMLTFIGVVALSILGAHRAKAKREQHA